MDIRFVTREDAADLCLPNEPFAMPGRFIPELKDGVWTYRTEYFETVQTMCFPDENYDFDKYSQDGFVLGAYEDGYCIGLGVFREDFWKYMYLYDLKVNAAHRGKGVGKALVAEGLREAKKRNYLGIFLQAQDNNLNACMFYLKTGFQIGGFNNRVYDGTSQEGKADIFFYLR